MKLWGGRFTKETDQLVQNFNESLSFDQKFYRQDIRGSIAHVKMLAKQGILTEADRDAIVAGLEGIREDLDSGRLVIPSDSEYEDIHSFVEGTLTERIGEAGKRLHTGRSRNDQVALDMKLYTRDEIDEMDVLVKELLKELLVIMEANTETFMPGFTHLQKAQPVTLAHHVGAYFEMVTFRQYKFDDGKNYADINLKKVKNKTEDTELEIRENADKSEEKINQDMKKKTNELIKEFRKQVGGLGYSSLKVNNTVVTNSIDYYCIKLSAYMSQADGYEVNYFYTIDKKTGQVIKLTDLFKKDSQYVDVITKDIKKQMKKKMKENSQYKYFINEEEKYTTFEKIDENQQFYINNSGELVICFAEGDVAPAYMGALEFTISHKTIQNILK